MTAFGLAAARGGGRAAQRNHPSLPGCPGLLLHLAEAVPR